MLFRSKIIVLKDHGLYNIGMEYTHNFVDALYETISKEKHFSKVTVTSGTLCGSSKTAAEKIQRIFPDYTEREFEENILELSTSETIPPLMVNVDDTRRVFLIYTLETQNTS